MAARAWNGDLRMVELLVDAGAHLNAQDGQHPTETRALCFPLFARLCSLFLGVCCSVDAAAAGPARSQSVNDRQS
jgi:hypothetical protein